MYGVYDLQIIRTNTDIVKPPSETLQQGRKPDRGLLDSPSPSHLHPLIFLTENSAP